MALQSSISPSAGILTDAMPRRKWRDGRFSERLLSVRKARGLTQVQLSRLTGISQRSLSYYETQDTYPPAPLVVRLAEALNVTTDELLGTRPLRKGRQEVQRDARVQWLWKRFQMVLALPERDQRAVVRLILSLTKIQAIQKNFSRHLAGSSSGANDERRQGRLRTDARAKQAA